MWRPSNQTRRLGILQVLTDTLTPAIWSNPVQSPDLRIGGLGPGGSLRLSVTFAEFGLDSEKLELERLNIHIPTRTATTVQYECPGRLYYYYLGL